MPSPFPGMDPWLEGEQTFPNLHERLTIFLQDAINAALPRGYVATTRNRVWVDDELRREPDVSLFGRDRNGARRPSDGGAAVATLTRSGLLTATAPTSDPHEEPYLEIRSTQGKRLVTAVEVVSRANKKPGDGGRTSYLQKQNEYRASSVNVVEIDLLRGGSHVTAFPANQIPPGTDYHVSILVPTADATCFLAPIRLADRLPVVLVPLDWEIEPVPIDLQPVFDRCYDGARYPDLVRYDAPPDPPLTPDQAAWAAGILREKGVPA